MKNDATCDVAPACTLSPAGRRGYRHSSARSWFGITAAGLNGIGQLFFIQAYPLWSMAMFAADIIIIHALATYAGPKLKKL